MWDLALSEHGDLIISGHGDLLGRTGQDLLEQRMKIRLLVPRGSWVYDAQKTFGSNLRRLIGMSPSEAAKAAPAYVREALRGMDEIVVDTVTVDTTNHDISLTIYYRVQDTSQGYLASGEELSLTISLPVAVSDAQGSGE